MGLDNLSALWLSSRYFEACKSYKTFSLISYSSALLKLLSFYPCRIMEVSMNITAIPMERFVVGILLFFELRKLDVCACFCCSDL